MLSMLSMPARSFGRLESVCVAPYVVGADTLTAGTVTHTVKTGTLVGRGLPHADPPLSPESSRIRSRRRVTGAER
jgi:hypothetical protein